MPLRSKVSDRCDHAFNSGRNEPVELIYKNRAERLLAMFGTRGFYLGRSRIRMTHRGEGVARGTYGLNLGWNELSESVLEGGLFC